MPHTKLSEPKYPPIDKLRACILERKMTMKLTWKDIAEVAKMDETYLRKMVPTKPSSDWNPEIRNAICKYLGIRVHVEVQDLFDLGGDD